MSGKEASAVRVDVSEAEPKVAEASNDLDALHAMEALERAADSIRPSWAGAAAAPVAAARVPDSLRPAFLEPEAASFTPDSTQPVRAPALAEVLARLSNSTAITTAQYWFSRSPALAAAAAALVVLTLGYALWPSHASLAAPPPPTPPPQLAEALARAAVNAPDTIGTAGGGTTSDTADSVPALTAESFAGQGLDAPATPPQTKPTPQTLKEARVKALRAKRREAAQTAPTKPVANAPAKPAANAPAKPAANAPAKLVAKKKSSDPISSNPYR